MMHADGAIYETNKCRSVAWVFLCLEIHGVITAVASHKLAAAGFSDGGIQLHDSFTRGF